LYILNYFLRELETLSPIVKKLIHQQITYAKEELGALQYILESKKLNIQRGITKMPCQNP
jgi:hypothetical protein